MSNGQRPEYGTVTVSFPISREEYDRVTEQLVSLEIDNSSKTVCVVNEIDGFSTALKIMEDHCVNMDELDYLAKRLDSFDDGEAAQFQGMESKMERFELKDLLNLTFC